MRSRRPVGGGQELPHQGGLAVGAGYSTIATAETDAPLEQERKKSESLLLNILPAQIASRLKDTRETIAEGFANVTVLFADIVGFTAMTAQMPAEAVVGLLNGIFSEFDELAGRLGLEKIKTIRDAYMVAGGLPDHRISR